MDKKELDMSRTLEDVCEDTDGGFYFELLGNHYCSLAPTKDRVECFHRGDKLDDNGMYNCFNPKYSDPNQRLQNIDSIFLEYTKPGNA